MAVHVPLSLEIQLEARVLIMSTNTSAPATAPHHRGRVQTIVLGLY